MVDWFIIVILFLKILLFNFEFNKWMSLMFFLFYFAYRDLISVACSIFNVKANLFWVHIKRFICLMLAHDFFQVLHFGPLWVWVWRPCFKTCRTVVLKLFSVMYPLKNIFLVKYPLTRAKHFWKKKEVQCCKITVWFIKAKQLRSVNLTNTTILQTLHVETKKKQQKQQKTVTTRKT